MPGKRKEIYVSSKMVPAPGAMRVVKRRKGQSTRTPARSYRKGETKYFDVGISSAVTFAGTSWADSEVPADFYVNTSGVAAAYTDSCLLPTAIGSGYGQVDGQKYKLEKLRVRGRLIAGSLSDQPDVTQPTNVRLLLVEDTRPNGAQAQGEDVLQDLGNTPENMYTFMRVADNTGRFRIWKDIQVQLGVSGVGADSLVAATNSIGFMGKYFKFSVAPRKEVSVKVGNATPTIAGTISSNFFLLCGGERAGTAVPVSVFCASRAYYTEM